MDAENVRQERGGNGLAAVVPRGKDAAGAWAAKFFRWLLSRVKKVFARLLYWLLSHAVRKDSVCFLCTELSAKFNTVEHVYATLDVENKIRIEKHYPLLKKLFLLARAKVLLADQADPVLSSLRLHPKTLCVQCWHSSGLYKKIGYDAVRKGYAPEDEEKRIGRIHGNISYFIISDAKLVPAYARAFRLPEERILPLGLCRTDLLFELRPDACRRDFCEAYGLDAGKKNLLYAPTFREAGNKRYHRYSLDSALLRSALGGQWNFLLRRHPSVASGVPEGWVDVSDSAQEACLAAADAMVTDYSSILFDYAYFHRPIYLIVPDLEEYLSEKGLYVLPDHLGVSGVCRSASELAACLQNLAEAPEKPISIWERFMGACDGRATDRLCGFIRRLLDEDAR